MTLGLLLAARAAGVEFIRGDIDANGVVEITDSVNTIGYLFLGSPAALDCEDAADADDDGDIELADVINVLAFLFTGGNAPPAPYPSCGRDPGIDGLSCRTFAACGGAPAGPAVILNEVMPRAVRDGSRLEEIRRDFPSFSEQFVELKVLAEGTSLGGFQVRAASGLEFTLPASISAQRAGAIYLIVFDGNDTGGDSIAHADRSFFADPESDSVELIHADGRVLDRIAWGFDRRDAVTLGEGGIISTDRNGLTYSRRPGTSSPGFPPEWTVTSPLNATPGFPNRAPFAELLLPPIGAILEAGAVRLDWYAAPNSGHYSIVVSRSRDLSDPVIARFVTDETVTTTLAVGEYFWQVFTLDENGATLGASPLHSFRVVGSFADLEEGLPPAEPQPGAPARLTLDRAPPLYAQRKDTRLLLLEAGSPGGTRRAWDAPHQFDRYDLACNANCGAATISMTNAHLAGWSGERPRLSQDRIGLEVFSRFSVKDPGPELDFNFGYGLNDREFQDGLEWAISSPVQRHDLDHGATIDLRFKNQYSDSLREELWQALLASIPRQRPVPLSIYLGGRHDFKHAVLAWGIEEASRGRYVLVNDPWSGGQRYWIDLSKLRAGTFFFLPDTVTPREDEPSLRTGEDADGDGITDFDEETRFLTRFKDARRDGDTDGDCLGDYDEVLWSAFDARHGWGTRRSGSPLSDGAARSGAQPELVADADDGGVPDFLEDRNRNGERDAGESDPYDPVDDRLIMRGTEQSIVDIRCPGKPFPESAYHDLTHSETATTQFELKAARNNENQGIMRGTVKVDHKGFVDFWVADQPGDCGETGLRRTAPPRRWEEEVVGRFSCVDRGSGPQIEFALTSRSGAAPSPQMHEHFCDHDVDLPYASVSDAVIFWIETNAGPNFPTPVKPIEGDHYEREDLFILQGCYEGTNRHTLKFDLER